ncbi:hypothetical protein [Acinetobacter baumannii]|uniref:hypothetical protein n=1 Tax=Acinetobacter baumannii TaxID=470 RepID=UPI00259FEBDB|nr:hypothetical protein [Acinetobacter baumannii]
MDNYKIKVKDEAESKEAQELFEQLGFKWAGDYPVDVDWYSHLYTENSNCCYLSPYVWGGLGDRFKELTLPQLQDLVVLKRNDVKDATHRDKRDETIYLTSDMVIYYWQGEWCKSAINKSNDHENYIANSLTPIAQPQDPALISGADVLRALADGKEVEGFSEENEEWIPIVYFSVQEVVNGLYKFRLKPQTIKLELELPKPFEPEEDCHVYILDDGKTDGYRRYSYEVHGDKGNTFIGIWRTEEEIKQVVEQLRKIRGTNS